MAGGEPTTRSFCGANESAAFRSTNFSTAWWCLRGSFANLSSYSTYRRVLLQDLPEERRSLFGGNSAFGERLKSGAVFQERHLDPANRAIALFGNNDFGP